MKVSEFIKELQKAKEKYGDLQVHIDTQDIEDYLNIIVMGTNQK